MRGDSQYYTGMLGSGSSGSGVNAKFKQIMFRDMLIVHA